MPADDRFNFDGDDPSTDGDEETTAPPKPRASGNPKQGQSLVVAVLVFLSAATLVFGSVSIVHNISAPFKGNGVAASASLSFDEAGGASELSDESLKKNDTDTDGLSDYDELRLHRTSPYLKDSDSDGYDDKQEIASGHDPLCPSGKTCTQQLDTSSSTQSGGSVPLFPAAFDQVNTSAGNADPFSQLESATPEQVRGLLLQKGFPQDKLSQLSDEDLMQLYRQTLEEVKSKQQSTKDYTQNQQAPTLPPLGLGGPTPDQLRQVLRESGQVTEEQLNSLSDDQLLMLYQQAIERQKAGGGK